MASDENPRGRGYGSRILEGLEASPWLLASAELCLMRVTEFYRKRGTRPSAMLKRFSTSFVMCGL